MFDRHVFLIGMPGSGKSSLGKRVAANMCAPYVDMDARIEQAFGCSVSDIFGRYGENVFRRAETNLLIHLATEPYGIVSTGGGAVLRPENLELMRNHGMIMLIDRPIGEIMGDIKLKRRPMLAAKGLSAVERMYYDRIAIYREAADVVLDNSFGYYGGVNGMERCLRALFRSRR